MFFRLLQPNHSLGEKDRRLLARFLLLVWVVVLAGRRRPFSLSSSSLPLSFSSSSSAVITRRRSLRLRHVRLLHQFGLPHPTRPPHIYPVPPSANILISPSVAISAYKDRSNDELGPSV